jgi:hypothetical protein
MKTQRSRKPTPRWKYKKTSPTDYQSQVDRLRAFSQWLLIIPLVMLILFACGQLGILTSRKIAQASTLTDRKAKYEPWPYALIHSINPEIIADLLHDNPDMDGADSGSPESSEWDSSWLDATPLPTYIALVEPTSTSPVTPTHTSQASPTCTLSQEQTPTPTNTTTQALQLTATATATSPPPTATAVLTPTSTKTITAQDVPTQTASPSPTSSNPPGSPTGTTLWLSSTSFGDLYTLIEYQPGGPSASNPGPTRFQSNPFNSGDVLTGGTSTIYLYATNPLAVTTEIGIIVSAGIYQMNFLGGTTITIPANTTTPTLFSRTFPIFGHSFYQNERLVLQLITDWQTTSYWDGEWNAARLVLPPITP